MSYTIYQQKCVVTTKFVYPTKMFDASMLLTGKLNVYYKNDKQVFIQFFSLELQKCTYMIKKPVRRTERRDF